MATNQLDAITKVYLGLVDVIFSIIIGVGFAQFVPITFQFKTFTILLAYTMVVGSWVGYHAAVKTSYKRPYRFFIDLILLYLYNYLINSVTDFFTMLVTFPIIFFFYFLWSLSRSREDKKALLTFSNKKNLIFLVIFVIQVLIYWFGVSHFKLPILIDASLFQWSFLIVSMMMVVLYRWLQDTATQNEPIKQR